MTLSWKKAITAVVLSLAFSASQVYALGGLQGSGTPKNGKQAGTKNGKGPKYRPHPRGRHHHDPPPPTDYCRFHPERPECFCRFHPEDPHCRHIDPSPHRP
jgi:hypothetical protein